MYNPNTSSTNHFYKHKRLISTGYTCLLIGKVSETRLKCQSSDKVGSACGCIDIQQIISRKSF